LVGETARTRWREMGERSRLRVPFEEAEMAERTMQASQEFVYVRTYARWLEAEGRRELSWGETVDRYLGYMKGRYGEKVPEKVWGRIEGQMKALGTVGSMRATWTAGEALDENHISAYNCAYLPYVDLRCVAEHLYILMHGTGVGFGTERADIEQMPVVAYQTSAGRGVHVVRDSKEGWAEALLVGLEAWFAGEDLEFDYSEVRKRGARLKKFGGRASGPEPLKKLLDFVRDIVLKAQGRKLSSIEWLDIGNMVGEVVVVGGVRRSAEINFSDLDDAAIRDAKVHPFPVHRYMSNNSAVYREKPSVVEFMREWTSLAASGSGERGIFNEWAVKQHLEKHAPKRQFVSGMRTNPCGEILLRPFQFCNLSEVVVRADDTFDDLVEKIEAAVWLGTMQAGLTDFKWLRPEWKRNCEEEALLGVSLTGQMDNVRLMSEEKLDILKAYARKVNKKAAKAIGINESAAITTGKPSGTVSQLALCGSGAHPWHDPYYLRRYRISATDPVFKMLKAQGFQFVPENGQGPKAVADKRAAKLAEGWTEEQAALLVPDWSEDQVSTWVVGFPTKAPEGAVTRHDMDCIAQLEWYLKLTRHWCEHNQSITVYVRDEEWLKVGAWVYDHFDEMVGVSFLPHSGGIYELAPYETISQEQYEALSAVMPKADWSQLPLYERMDETEGAKTLACTGNACELV
jgi:ribonucleoside-triphosphate reductase